MSNTTTITTTNKTTISKVLTGQGTAQAEGKAEWSYGNPGNTKPKEISITLPQATLSANIDLPPQTLNFTFDGSGQQSANLKLSVQHQFPPITSSWSEKIKNDQQ
jgi:hypothetical protein